MVSCFLVIEQIDMQDGLSQIAYLDIPHVDIFRHSSPARIRLDPQCAIEIRTAHHAFLGKYIPDISRYLAANNHPSVSVFHDAIANNDIFARYIDAATIMITP